MEWPESNISYDLDTFNNLLLLQWYASSLHHRFFLFHFGIPYQQTADFQILSKDIGRRSPAPMLSNQPIQHGYIFAFSLWLLYADQSHSIYQ